MYLGVHRPVKIVRMKSEGKKTGVSNIDLPHQMREKLRRFQRKVWGIKLVEGLLAAAFGLLISWLLVFVLDRFWDTPQIVRALILLGGAGGLGLWFPLVCHRWIWKSRRLEQVARLVKYKSPRFGDQLLGIIELVNSNDQLGRSEALTRAALAQVNESMKDRDLSGAVPKPQHKKWARIVAVPAVIALIAFVTVPAAGSNSFVRWLMPWKDIDRYTFTQIDQLPEKLVVPVSEPSSLAVRLKEDSRWNPESGSISVGGNRVAANRIDGKFDLSLIHI